MSKFGMGQPMRRVEDSRFVIGKGRYSDDISRDGQAYGLVIRSPFAHGVIKSIDLSAVRSAPGVLQVFDHNDHSGVIPCEIANDSKRGIARAEADRPIFASKKVTYVGEPLAFVVAESLIQAKDAAELIDLDVEELPAFYSTRDYYEEGAVPIHEGAPRNVAFDWSFGEKDKVDEAFSAASHVTSMEIINNRIVCNAMEPRAAIAWFDESGEKLTIETCTQGGWGFKDLIAKHLSMDSANVRVITADVGGGFGMKAMFFHEYSMVSLAARALKRPVKWTGDRSESFLADNQGRDHVTTAEIALNADNRIMGIRVKTIAGMGAQFSNFAPFIPTAAALKVLPGVYDIPVLSYDVTGVFTNTAPVDAYRGAGRPESIYCIERLIDAAARELSMDPAELRRINFVRSDQMPYKTAAGELYDTGEFELIMDRCMKEADYAGHEARKKEARSRGRLSGIGMCYYIESTMGDPTEHATVEFGEDGMVSVMVGTQSNGQGHETAYAQVLHSRLGVPFDKIRVVQGDTDKIAGGGGTGGSRSLTAQGMAIADVSDKIIENGKDFASQHFEASVADISFSDGTFEVAGTDRRVDIMSLAGIARTMTAADGSQGLDATAKTVLSAWTFPNGCHIAEIELDPDTGVSEVTRYTIVDDFGFVVNPLLVEGQVHGGAVQGIGQALFEQTVYDGSGQLVSGSFMDYAMPRADNMPSFSFHTEEVLCKNNALGIKGCGEAGTVGACASVINALVDATGKKIQMPATPFAVWKLLQAQAA